MARQALGKGLEALIPGSRSKTAAVPVKGTPEISINDIRANPNQPRKRFAPEKLEELIKSVKSKGILEPLIVKESGNKYELIAGERRFIAAQRAGLKTVPVIIKNVSPAEQLEIGLIENIMRQDLNPVEEAKAFKDLMEMYKYTQEELSDRLGINRANVANIIRVLKLPAEVQQYIMNEELSLGHAKVLLGVEDKIKQRQMAEQAVRKGLSVRDLEALLGKMPSKKTGAKQQVSAEMKSVENKMKLHFGTKVSIKGNYKKGVIVIEYYNSEDFERITEIMRIK
jgi:ParB family transcriptional regulator, chromosome partitioning protein